MTEQPAEEISLDNLQPLDFRLLLDDGVATVYQAVFVDGANKELPVYTVTITIASAIRREAEKELLEFLGGITAAFALLPEPPSQDGLPDVEPFDISTQMKIELNLVSLQSEGPVGVQAAMVMGIGAGGGPPVVTAEDPPVSTPEAEPAAEDAQAVKKQPGGTIPPGGKDQYWWAYCNEKLTLTVRPTSGYGTIRNPKKNVNSSNPNYLTARQVIVHADSNGGMVYLTGASFSGPHAGPRKGKPC